MSIFTDAKHILFLGAHPDDEVCCAGTLYEAIQNRQPDQQITALVFSPCLASLMPLPASPGKPNPNMQLYLENDKAMNLIGFKPEDVRRFDIPVRKFPQFRQEILQILYDYNKGCNPSPDLILMPSLNDRHQDHKTLAEEAVRAFPHETLLSWTVWHKDPVGLLAAPPAYKFFDRITAQIPMSCMMVYKSQQKRVYMDPLQIMEVLRSNALRAGSPLVFAEKFEVVRVSL